MSEFDGAGATGASESGSSGGGDVSSPAAKSFRDQAYETIVRSEHVSTEDFVDETRDREAEERGDPEVNSPLRKQRRAERYQRALEAASKAGDSNLMQEAGRTPAHQEGSEGPQAADAEEHWNREREAIYHAAQHHLRAAEFSRVQPDYHEMISSVLTVYQPAEHIAGALVKSPVGPQLAYELAKAPEAVEMLNQLPEAEAMRRLAVAEGALMERARSQQEGGPGEVQRLAERQRRATTKAPPPMKTPRGGADPHKDWVNSNDMDQFARGLKADMARRSGRGR